MLVFARNFLGTLLREATRGAPLPRPRCAFCGGSGKKFPACTCFLRGKFVAGNPDPKGVRRGERSRTSKRRRARDQHRASDRGRAGKNWRNGARAEILRRPGRLLRTHFRQPPTIKFSVSPPSPATRSPRVKCTHTKPHPVCRLPSDRARHGRLRRRYTAASICCRHGKRLRNAPHGEVRHRWVASATGASFRCINISWTAAMRSPI